MAPMETVLSAPEVFIALVVAAHAAVLALRLSISLYEACFQRTPRSTGVELVLALRTDCVTSGCSC